MHRNVPSVRDIRTLLLHCSLATPSQQLKQSFQTFAALPGDETEHLTSQSQAVLTPVLSEGSVGSGVIAKALFKSLILSAVSLGDAVIDPWMEATRHGRVDAAEVCCYADSLLSGAVASIGGRAVQYSHWNGFDLTTKAGTDKLKEVLLERKPRVVWVTPPCTTQRTQQSQSRSKCHRIQMNILAVFLWLVKQDWREAILEQMWGSTSHGRGGVFFRVERAVSQWQNTRMSVGVASLMELFLQNPGTPSVHIDVSQICFVLDDVLMIILIKLWRKKRRSEHRRSSRLF